MTVSCLQLPVLFCIQHQTLPALCICLMKNSKDYLKRCIKFVNSTVVVHYYLTEVN